MSTPSRVCRYDITSLGDNNYTMSSCLHHVIGAIHYSAIKLRYTLTHTHHPPLTHTLTHHPPLIHTHTLSSPHTLTHYPPLTHSHTILPSLTHHPPLTHSHTILPSLTHHPPLTHSHTILPSLTHHPPLTHTLKGFGNIERRKQTTKKYPFRNGRRTSHFDREPV